MTDAVDTFRRFVWLITKWILVAILVVVGLIAAIAAAVYGYNWYVQTRHEEKVEITIFTDGTKLCKESKYPLFVGFANKSGRTIESVSFTLRANRPGYSSDLAKYHSYKDDKIIKPKEGYGTCWAVPELTEAISDPRALEWTIKYKTIVFRD